MFSAPPAGTAPRGAAASHGGIEQLHLLSQGIERAVLNDADSRDTLTDNLGNFPVIQILNKSENDHLALLFPQEQDRLTDQFLLGGLLVGPFRVTALLRVNDAVVQLGRIAL